MGLEGPPWLHLFGQKPALSGQSGNFHSKYDVKMNWVGWIWIAGMKGEGWAFDIPCSSFNCLSQLFPLNYNIHIPTDVAITAEMHHTKRGPKRLLEYFSGTKPYWT